MATAATKRFTYRRLNEVVAGATDGKVAVRNLDGKGETLGFVFFDRDRDEARAKSTFKRFTDQKMSAHTLDEWAAAAKEYLAATRDAS